MGLIGKRCSGCAYCTHSNKSLMKCFPESDDCKKEYDLDQIDFLQPCNCDFFEEEDSNANR